MDHHALRLQVVARAKLDGYTAFMTAGSIMTINPSLYENPGFEPVEDFRPVAAIGRGTMVLVANAEFRADSVADLIR